MLTEKLGKWHFWLFLIGFHLAFDFMHIPGLLGMPRRIYTYEPGRGWDGLNLIVTVGTFFQAAAILCFVCNLVWSYFQGRRADNDPWDAWTLEWTTSSPPPTTTSRFCRQLLRQVLVFQDQARSIQSAARCFFQNGTPNVLRLLVGLGIAVWLSITILSR